MNILIVYGTRPEWLKIKPIVEELKKSEISYKILKVFQHTDLIEDMPFDMYISAKYPGVRNRLSSVMSAVVAQVSCILSGTDGSDISYVRRRGRPTRDLDNVVPEKFTHVLVQGDTHTAVSAALAAFNDKIPVIHIEAGLRTHDLEQPYPEESNRQIISRLASYHFCPTEEDRNNLIAERASGKMYVVGNTVLDNIRDIEPKFGSDVLITMHRRENHENIQHWFEEFEKIAEKDEDLTYYFVSHPNPNVQKHLSIFKKIKVLQPMNHEEFIKLVASCRYVITDSGGLQEESAFFDKVAVVCREKTERMAGVHTGHHVLFPHYSMVWQMPDVEFMSPNEPCPYGDGHAAEKIVEILKTLET